MGFKTFMPRAGRTYYNSFRFQQFMPHWLLPIFVFHILFTAPCGIYILKFYPVYAPWQLLIILCVIGIIGPMAAMIVIDRLKLSKMGGFS